MKKIIVIILTASMALSCSTVGNISTGDSGTFRGRWWNYYNRALTSSDTGRYENAIRDLRSAIERREKDQRRSRTYGMHFIDYFPHRELGIIYFNMGKIDRAVSELELSLSQAESAKAIFYLNKARRQQLLDLKIQPAPPEIIVKSPADDSIVNDFTLTVKGTVSAQGYVSRLLINDIPYRVDLARNTVSFEHPVVIDSDTKEITIVTEDLLGNTSVKSIPLRVDREGPAISIFDIVREHRGRDEIIRITGEIDDSTGIVSVTLNDKVIDTGGRKSYEFNVIADKMMFMLKASDRLNNVTRAQIDIAKELAAFHKKQAPVLLAFSGTDMFSSDNVPPVITLKEAADMPAVFVDKYYVEGEVSDNGKVESVIVNARDVLSRKGKKIFFGRLVKLDEGKNRINIEAFDSSGNRSKKYFTVTRNIPEALQIGNRMSVSILPFDMTNAKNTGEMLAYEHLTGSFVSQKRFNVIERAKLEQVLLEQKLTKEKLTDPDYSIKVGRLMSADTIISTTAAVNQNSVEFTATVINTETSEVMEIKDVYSEDRSASTIKQMMEGLASKVASGFPLVEGHVIRKEKGFVYTDLGSESIKGDTGVIVYRLGQEIKHPLTGKSLGQDMKSLGTARLQEIHEKFSKAKLSDTSGASDINAQDLVITR